MLVPWSKETECKEVRMKLYAYSIRLKRAADRDYTVVKIFSLTLHLHSNFMLYNGMQKGEVAFVDICCSIHWILGHVL